MAEVIDFSSRNKTPEPPTPIIMKPGRFSFHIHGTDEDHDPGEIESTGYLKFGPAFIAVVDGPEDSANVLMAVQTAMVKYVKRLDAEGTIEATLSV